MKQLLSQKMWIAALSALLFCTSCGDKDLLDSDKWSESIDWQPDFTLPLAHGEYTLWDMLNQFDSDSLLVNEGNQLMIKYTEKDIFQLNAADLYALPEQNIAFNLSIDLENKLKELHHYGGSLLTDAKFSQSITQELDLPEGTTLESLIGSLKFAYTLPKMPFKYSVSAKLLNVFTENYDTVAIHSTSEYNTVREQESFTDVEMRLSDGKNTIKLRVDIEIPKYETVEFDKISAFHLAFGVSDVRFTTLVGKVLPQTVNIESGDFKMDVEFWKYFNGSFNFAAPKLDLILKTRNVSIPVELNMSMDAYGDAGKQVTLIADPLRFNGNGLVGLGYFEESQTYDTTNSNIAALLSLPPKDRITYGGRVIVNPDSSKIYINQSASASADVRITIPMSMAAENLVFKDTIDDIDISDAENIKRASITILSENSIPLSLQAGNLYLLNENHESIDSVKVDKLLDAPAINAAGEVIAPAKGSCKVELSEKNILHLNQTKFIVIAVGASTSNNGQTTVELKPDAKLLLKLLLSTKLDMK